MVDENSATATCSRASCPNEAAFTCAYVDRRRHACATAWCPNHGVDIKGIHYCPRHASTVIAVGEEAIAAGHLPELENRVPSLVYWVGRDLDSDVPVILATLIKESDNESLMVDPVALVAGGGRHDVRRWERNWKVVSHTGISQRVTLQVLEGEPEDIVLRVGQVVVLREKPPWITAREESEDPEVAGESNERRAFYRRLTDAITHALDAQKALPYH